MEDAKKALVMRSPWFWVRDTQGHGSVTVTLVAVSFVVTTIAYILSVFEKIGPFVVRPFDVAASGSYFGIILALYGGRKWTEAKYTNGNGQKNETIRET